MKMIYYIILLFIGLFLWSEASKLFPEELKQKYIDFLTKSWLVIGKNNLKRAASWALNVLLSPEVSPAKIKKIKNIKTEILNSIKSPSNEYDRLTSIYLGYLIGIELDKKEVDIIFKADNIHPRRKSNLHLFAEKLGIKIIVVYSILQNIPLSFIIPFSYSVNLKFLRFINK